MITTRQKIFIGIAVLLGVIAVILWLYFFVLTPGQDDEDGTGISGGEGTTTGAGQTVPGTLDGDTGQVEEPEYEELSGPEQQRLYAKQLARIFVERFSSYSNQNDNRHIDDVLDMSTAQMAEWLETQRQAPGDVHSGVTTVVIASRVTSFSDSSAEVAVDVQQLVEEAEEESTQQRSGRVNLVKVGDDWKVNGLYWD